MYSAYETGLFYHARSAGSPKLRSSTCFDQSNVFVNMLWYLNISRTHKWKLLVTGKRAKPRCFKRINMDSLPVSYYPNKNV
jgi:hypothetical protein